MEFREVVVEGIPGTSGVLRYPFEKGLNAWKQKGAVRLETLVSILESLLYPSAESGLPLGPGRAQRAGITFEAGGVTYRLMRDYCARTVRLSQLQPGSQTQFRDLSSDLKFIQATLTRSVKLPPKRAFSYFLVATPGGRRAQETSKPHFDVAIAPVTDPKRRLAQLRTEQRHLEDVKKLEEEVDHHQRRLFQFDEQLRKLVEPTERAETLRKEYEAYRKFDAPGLITPQILQRLKHFPKLVERKEEGLAGLEEKSKLWNEDLASIPVRHFWKEIPVYVGAGVAPLFFVAASFAPRKFLALMLGGVALGLGTVVWGVLQGLRREERIQRLRADIRGLDGEKAGIDKRFEIEASAVQKFFDAVGMSDIAEIEEALAKRDSLAVEKKGAEEDLALLKAEIPEERIRKERGESQAKLTEAEEKLRGIPPVSIDPHGVEREIRELEAIVSSSQPVLEPSVTPSTDDPIQTIIMLAAEVLGLTPADLLRRSHDGMSTNVSTLCQRKVVGIDVRTDQIHGFVLPGGSSIPWMRAQLELQQAGLFGVQFTLWQMLMTHRAVPVIVDLVSTAVPEALAKLMMAAASHLGKKSQVLLLTL